MSTRPSVDQRDAEDDELLENEMDALPDSDPVNGSRTGQTASRWLSIYNMAYTGNHRQWRNGTRSWYKMGRIWQGEEVLDTILLFVRNGVQFWRLGTIIRRSGHSIFHPPRPIDLSQARSAAFDLDLNLDDDEALAAHHMTTNASTGGYQELASSTIPQGGIGAGKAGRAFFDAAEEVEEGVAGTQRQGVFGNGIGQVGYQAGREALAQDDQEHWDRLT
ncbi:hypothetical protein QFC22_000769 [Naganishia vaughanmartiniae]|uniref:Uncharacterized protein n=1 Tax=Naganishia vaughanmartiniae TaxID=1424756 RepID=A0ACC2XK18_9TREE|nr:hypothetical protein QFC22_000769 [Naganishia vaughanmartiniae]